MGFALRQTLDIRMELRTHFAVKEPGKPWDRRYVQTTDLGTEYCFVKAAGTEVLDYPIKHPVVCKCEHDIIFLVDYRSLIDMPPLNFVRLMNGAPLDEIRGTAIAVGVGDGSARFRTLTDEDMGKLDMITELGFVEMFPPYVDNEKGSDLY